MPFGFFKPTAYLANRPEKSEALWELCNACVTHCNNQLMFQILRAVRLSAGPRP